MIFATCMIASALWCRQADTQEKANNLRDKDAEIARLHREIERLSEDRGRMRSALTEVGRKLAAAEREIARLETMASAHLDCAERAGEWIREFFAALVPYLEESGGAYWTARYLGGMHAGLTDWIEIDPARRELALPAITFLGEYIRKHGGEEKRAAGRREYRDKNYPAITVSPARLLEELEGVNRADHAAAIAPFLGKIVTWRGVIIQRQEHQAADSHLTMLCDSVLVEIRLARWAQSQFRDIEPGGRIVARGKIAEIGGNEWLGVSVKITEAAAAADPTGTAMPPGEPKAPKRSRSR